MKHLLAYLVLASTSALSGCAYNANQPTNQYSAGLQQLKIGMPQSEALALVGEPDRVSQTMNASGVSQQYVYSSAHFQTPGQQIMTGFQQGVDGVSHEKPTYLYFQNGHLTAVQN